MSSFTKPNIIHCYIHLLSTYFRHFTKVNNVLSNNLRKLIGFNYRVQVIDYTDSASAFHCLRKPDRSLKLINDALCEVRHNL